LINTAFVALWLLWLIAGGFDFLVKLLDLLLSSALLLSLDWGTNWTTQRVSATIFIFSLFFLTAFLVLRLNIRMFRK